MALSSDRRSASPKKKKAPPAEQSLAANQSAADEIEKLLNGFCVDDGAVDIPAPEAPAAPSVPSPVAGLPVEDASVPSLADGPVAGGEKVVVLPRPLDESAFADLPPAVTADEEPPPAPPAPPRSDAAGAESFSLDDFVLPEAETEQPPPPLPSAGPAPAQVESPPPLPEPPPLPADDGAAGASPEETADAMPDEVRRPGKKGKGRRGRRKIKAPRQNRKPGNESSTAWAVLVVLLVVAIYGYLFYGSDLLSGVKKGVGTIAPKAPSIQSVVGDVKKTLEKVGGPKEDKPAVVPSEPKAAVEAPLPVKPRPVPAVSSVPAGSSRPVETTREEKTLPALPTKKTVEAKAVPPVEGRLEGNEIVPTNTVFVEWPDIMVTAILGRGEEGGAIINDEVISIGEPCAAGPVLRSVAPQRATFEWHGDRRDYFINTKSWGDVHPKKK